MRSEIIRQRLEKDPHNPLFRFSLGQALFQEERWEEACEHLNFCVAHRADWMMPRILLGKALLELKRPQEAKPVLEEALQLAIEQNHEDPADELRKLLASLECLR